MNTKFLAHWKECVNVYPELNIDEQVFWDHIYRVWLAKIIDPITVNADNEQDALDEAVDYAEAQGWNGLFLDEANEAHLSEFDEVVYAGNHGLPLSIDEIHIERIA